VKINTEALTGYTLEATSLIEDNQGENEFMILF